MINFDFADSIGTLPVDFGSTSHNPFNQASLVATVEVYPGDAPPPPPQK